MVLDGGPCESGIESTIIGFEKDEPIIYRLGSTPIEAIKNVVGKISIKNKKEVAPARPTITSGAVVSSKSNIMFKGESFSKQYKNMGFELSNIDMEIKAGELTGIVGENGNGKTTLLRIFRSVDFFISNLF